MCFINSELRRGPVGSLGELGWQPTGGSGFDMFTFDQRVRRRCGCSDPCVRGWNNFGASSLRGNTWAGHQRL
eukprot:11305083-Alexandrium_andersonii.AAC.1